MIDKTEILNLSTQMSLAPNVIEKDYVLGWMIAGISNHPILRETWVFKGGTCLKKCYFETYRFSEDLDFTLLDPAHLNEQFLKDTFADIGEWIYEQTGIQVPAKDQVFDIYTNPRGTISCQGKVSYRGPISPPSMPRIKLDLTADERLVLPPVRTPIFHPYSDRPDGIDVLAYAYEEVFGEKVRALGERTRPRDLYDVINLFRNDGARPSPFVLLDVLTQKCDFKGIDVPTLLDIEAHKQELLAQWGVMLEHQLPALPPYQSFLGELPNFFDWLNGNIELPVYEAYQIEEGETILRERDLGSAFSVRERPLIEIIRFGAANRLLIDLEYQNSTRRIEAYSLRRTSNGDIVLHAVKANSGEHRTYRVDRIQGARITNQNFTPKYKIELTPSGPLSVIPTTLRTSTPRINLYGRIAAPTRRIIAKPKRRVRGKITYVYQCPLCSKKFRRDKMDSRLNPHKNEWGGNCAGRTGFLVDTKY